MTIVLALKIVLIIGFYYLSVACIVDAIANFDKSHPRQLQNLNDPLGLKIFGLGDLQTKFLYQLFDKNKYLIRAIVILPILYCLGRSLLDLIDAHRGSRYEDFRFFYAVGVAVINRVNPYLGIPDPVDPNTSLNFPYLPNLFPLLMSVGWTSINISSILFNIIGAIAIFFVCLGANRLISDYRFLSKTTTWICLSLFGLTFDVVLGNITTITIAFVIWFFVFLKENRQIPASIFLALSAIKPTLSIFLFIFILAKKRFRIFSFAIGITILMMITGLLVAGINPFNPAEVNTGFINPWRNAISTNIDGNAYGSEFTSISRIDINVLGARLVKDQASYYIAVIISTIVKMILLAIVALKLFMSQSYRSLSQELSPDSNHLDLKNIFFLRDISLVSLLTITFSYAQNTNNSILIVPVLFLLIYKLYEFKASTENSFSGYIWRISLFLIMVHTSISYGLFSYLFGYDEIYIQSITIGLLPNLAIVALIICISVMPLTSLAVPKVQNSIS